MNHIENIRRMTPRDRAELVNLIFARQGQNNSDLALSMGFRLADLEDGLEDWEVIIPPCKIGEKFWIVSNTYPFVKITEHIVNRISLYQDENTNSLKWAVITDHAILSEKDLENICESLEEAEACASVIENQRIKEAKQGD